MNTSAESFAEHLLDGDKEEALQMLTHYTASGSNSLYLYDRIITPAMHYIGHLWEQNLISVADEHLATGLCDQVMNQYTAGLPAPSANQLRAMFFCVENEEHHLGVKIVANMFHEKGWEVRNYGANLPIDYAMITAFQWKPQVIGISVSILANLPRVYEYVEAIQKLTHGPTVLIGGRVASKYIANDRLPDNVQVMQSILELHDWLHLGRGTQSFRSKRQLGRLG